MLPHCNAAGTGAYPALPSPVYIPCACAAAFIHAAERRLPLLDVAACQRAPVELCQRLKCRKAGDAAHALYRLNDAVVVAHDEREISKRKTASLLSDADVAQLMQPPCSAPYTASAFSIPLPMPMRFLTCDSCCSGMPVTRSLND